MKNIEANFKAVVVVWTYFLEKSGKIVNLFNLKVLEV